MRPTRIVTVWCPDWPVVAAGVPPEMPAAVMHANRVVARTPAAAEQGVVVGQRRRQAQRRCPEIQLLDDDPARDAREFEPVMRAIADSSPRLEMVEPGWVALGSRGPSRYFGGDGRYAGHLADVLAELVGEREVGIGIADGRFASGVAARLAVRRGSPLLVEPGSTPDFCAPLPIGWLQALGEVDADLVDLFVRLGLRRLGDLATLPPSDVLGRFGSPGIHAHRLAGGGDPRPSATVDPPPERRLDRVLDDPAAQSEAVVFVAKQLADEVAESLGQRGQVCTRLVVLLETENGERSERVWYRSAGFSAAAMVELVRWQVDGWIGQPRGRAEEITAGIVLVRLLPDEVRADDGEQLGLWGGESDADRRAARAIARLTTLASEPDVTVPVWHGGRLPADRYRWVPATTVDLRRRGLAGTDESGPWPGTIPAPSPATVFPEPRPIEVTDEQGRPVAVTGRGALSGAPVSLRPITGDGERGWRRGPERTITAWAGPWPVEEHWWEPERHRRVARFQMTTDDGRAHLVLAEQQRWWIGAAYD